MKIIRADQAKKFKNSDKCIATEYPLDDKDINIAVVEVLGRYPEEGRVANLKCKELLQIIKGSGKVVIEGEEINFKEGDEILIEPGEKYYWDCRATMIAACAPAWYPEQHQECE
jgi:mannose-6-phosphate isomerase-like protein (cupin superfamily)